MSTRSAIGIEQADGKIKAVYCHSDGYPSHNGRMLTMYYSTKEMVEAILKLGNISFLDKSIEKPVGHSFAKRVDGYSTFYRRDRGDQGESAKVYPNAVSIFNSLDADWVYVFKPKENAWYFMKYDEKELRLLTEVNIQLDYKDGGSIKGDVKFDYTKLNYTIGGL